MHACKIDIIDVSLKMRRLHSVMGLSTYLNNAMSHNILNIHNPPTLFPNDEETQNCLSWWDEHKTDLKGIIRPVSLTITRYLDIVIVISMSLKKIVHAVASQSQPSLFGDREFIAALIFDGYLMLAYYRTSLFIVGSHCMHHKWLFTPCHFDRFDHFKHLLTR